MPCSYRLVAGYTHVIYSLAVGQQFGFWSNSNWAILRNRGICITNPHELIVTHHIMVCWAFVVVKEIFYHSYREKLTPRKRLNDENSYAYVNSPISMSICTLWNIHQKMGYTDPCHFLIKRALVSPQSTLVVATYYSISHDMTLSIYSPTISVAMI